MNRALLAAVAVSMACSGCVVRASGPRVVVTEPVPPPVVVAPPPPVVVVPQPVVIHPPVLVSQPRVVIVPGTQVYTVPSASFNVFVYGGQYYSYHQGSWFHSPRHGAPWTPVAVTHVPAQVRAVPAKHWKIPPGQDKHGSYDRPDERRVSDRRDDDKKVIIEKREEKRVIIDKQDDKRVIVDKREDKKVVVDKKDDKRVIVDRKDDDDNDRCPPGQSKKGKC